MPSSKAFLFCMHIYIYILMFYLIGIVFIILFVCQISLWLSEVVFQRLKQVAFRFYLITTLKIFFSCLLWSPKWLLIPSIVNLANIIYLELKTIYASCISSNDKCWKLFCVYVNVLHYVTVPLCVSWYNCIICVPVNETVPTKACHQNIHAVYSNIAKLYDVCLYKMQHLILLLLYRIVIICNTYFIFLLEMSC